MADQPAEPATQRTPQGQEIPVPSRADVFGDLAKVARGKRPARDADERSGDGERRAEQ